MQTDVQIPISNMAELGDEFRMRAAAPEDAKEAAELIYLPMGKFADYLFGFDDPEKARAVIAGLFAQKKNRFSYEFATVIETKFGIVGVLLAYPSDKLHELSLPMGKQLKEIIGVRGIFRLLRRSLRLMREKETGPGEYYLYTVSVREDYQSNGLGRVLLERAEVDALNAGLTKCSLGVTIDNTRAVSFYERLGFAIVETVEIPHLNRAIGYPGYHRMVKILH